jgi:hypothetical protein
MGAVESSMAASTPSRRIRTQFGARATVWFSRIAKAIGLGALCACRAIDDSEHFFERMT